MFLSIFDIFKRGVGPSSSHTMGPMTAAYAFVQALSQSKLSGAARRIEVRLFGSLAFTGRGHATDKAVSLGLLGHEPGSIVPDRAEADLRYLAQKRVLRIGTADAICCDPNRDIIFDISQIRLAHPNSMMIIAFGDGNHSIFAETYDLSWQRLRRHGPQSHCSGGFHLKT